MLADLGKQRGFFWNCGVITTTTKTRLIRQSALQNLQTPSCSQLKRKQNKKKGCRSAFANFFLFFCTYCRCKKEASRWNMKPPYEWRPRGRGRCCAARRLSFQMEKMQRCEPKQTDPHQFSVVRSIQGSFFWLFFCVRFNNFVHFYFWIYFSGTHCLLYIRFTFFWFRFFFFRCSVQIREPLALPVLRTQVDVFYCRR